MNAATIAARVPPGPASGSPPTLEWVALDRLQIDGEYQRTADTPTSRRIIAGMQREWKWPLCQPLAVSRRADGSMWVLDGQHRLEGARRRGDIAHLPCVIVTGIEQGEEARTFIDLNTQRQKLSENDKFIGMLAAGDATAKLVAQMLRDTDWRITRKNNTSHWKPGELQCAPMLVGLVRQRGEGAVRFALGTLRAAYMDEPVRPAATLLRALVDLFPSVASNAITAQKLCTALEGTPPSGWLARAVGYRERNPGLSSIGALSTIIMQAVLPAAKPVAKVAAPVAPPQRPAAQPAPRATSAPARKSPFDAEGKAFCEQCDRRVTRGAASACGDRHCKLRAFS